MIGIPFGDPRHPYTQNSENARKAGKKGSASSPWRLHPMVVSKKADEIFASRAKIRGEK